MVKALVNNITLQSVHMRSQLNSIFDLLFRSKVLEVRQQAPHLDSVPLYVPHQLDLCCLLQPQ